jgi:dienelactone hydrolase
MTIQTRSLTFTDGEITMHGHVAFDDAVSGPRPGVLVCPDAGGLGDYPKRRAGMLAELGYAALAMDYYGDGLVPQGDETMKKLGEIRNDRPLIRRRANAGLDALRSLPEVDPRRLAAIGYCFGGTMAIELARSGAADLQAVVTFHSGLLPAEDGDAERFTSRLLLTTGADDPLVPPEAVLTFTRDMQQTKADWQILSFGNTVHSFSRAGTPARPGFDYSETADRRSWAAMTAFFAEAFPR